MADGRHLQIQTTSICNGNCAICPYVGSEVWRTRHVMDKKTFALVVSRVKESGLRIKKLPLYMQGEPLTDPYLFERIEQVVKELTFDTFELSTNLILMNEEKAHRFASMLKDTPTRFIISFHGTSKAEYDHIMHLNYEENLNKAEMVFKVLSAKNFDLRVSAVDMHDKANAFWKKRFSEWGITRNITLNTFKPKNRGGNLKGEYGSTVRKTKVSCGRHKNWCHIDVDGQVVMCCDDYQRSVVFGDLHTTPLMDIIGTIRTQVSRLAKNPDFLCYHCNRCKG